MNLKKLLVIPALATILTTSFAPQKANAIYGVSTGNVTMALSGLGLYVFSMSDASIIAFRDNNFLVYMLGLMLLDSETGVASFSELSEADLSEVGINSEKGAIYNNEVEELNIVFETIQAELSNIVNPTREDSKDLWNIYAEELSVETMEVVKAITSKK
ncbi:MAG: hypothetical protein BM556_01750 [Bacteriovorax sp. MedPE-SWde]|nr:MAG: hypothetical protein BM556_01750 [Bacteriovorax sp. MedPE-SWde]